jgi:class 3 adenylate cyclase
VLELIRVPTMVIQRSSFALAPVEHGRYLAEHIQGARFVEISGGDMTAVTDPETIGVILDQWEEFLTGQLREPAPDRVLATVLFTDVVGSTEHAAQIGDHRWKELLDRLDHVTRGEIEKVGGRLVNATGDGHLATFDGPGKAIRCALSLIDAVHPLGIKIRAGLHTGEVELRGTDVGGIAVHIGARVASLAEPSEVLVSRTVTDLVAGSGIEFTDRGEHTLKGVRGEWRLFAVKD